MIGDNGGASAAAHLPRTTYAAAHNAALASAYVLIMAVVGPIAARVVEPVLERVTTAQLYSVDRWFAGPGKTGVSHRRADHAGDGPPDGPIRRRRGCW
ncbi:hypothetical protein [Nocardia cyriacigeorgica]|uniref:hypothetical protein n=1 Tax=Nocardia cyriacigeorgica TaxID=135487 RepID=UPI0024580502|nr:hypothetical protein [Nocardia cyriacigeorgica]